VTVTINGTNDGPVISMAAAQSTPEDQTLVFSVGNGNLISVSDVDDATLAVTLASTNGTLTLSGTGGLAFTVGDGSGDTTMTFSGTVADINAALAGMSYLPDTDYNGPAQISIATSDGTTTTNSAVAITVSPETTPALDLDSTAGGTSYSTTFTENGAAVSVVGPNVAISDFDDTNIELATVVLTNAQAGDVLAAGSMPAGISATVVGNTVTLSGSASLADYRAALQAVTFDNGSENPSTTPRSITVTVNDGDTDSNVAVSTIAVTAVNDAPVSTIVDASFTATEQAALSLVGGGLSVSDVDGPAISATLSVGEGVLNVGAGTTGAAVSNSGTATVTVTGTQAQINAVLAGNNGASVDYLNSSDTPSASTTLTLSASDGTLSGADSATITIVAVNDAPVSTIVAAGYTATEQTPLSLLGGGLSVGDLDGPSVSATLSVGEGVLNVGAGATGATVAASGTGTVTVTGTQAQINALLAGANGATVDYLNASDTPSASTTLTLTATDGSLASSDTATIGITAVNDAPVYVTPIADQTPAAGVPFSFTVPPAAFADPDSLLTYSASLADGSALPAWLAFDPATGTFGGTPPAGFAPVAVRVTASDGASTASATFAVSAPVAAVPVLPVTPSDGAAGALPGALPGGGQPIGQGPGGGSQIAPASPPAGQGLGTLPLGQPVDASVPASNLGSTFAPSASTPFSDFFDLNDLPPTGAGPSDLLGFPVARVSVVEAATRASGRELSNLMFSGHRLFVFQGIPGMRLGTDGAGFLSVPQDAFAHTDPSAIVHLEAHLAGGTPLPSWLKFDGLRGAFSGVPPRGLTGPIEIEVLARDT
jgi:hypothetical protein